MGFLLRLLFGVVVHQILQLMKGSEGKDRNFLLALGVLKVQQRGERPVQQLFGLDCIIMDFGWLHLDVLLGANVAPIPHMHDRSLQPFLDAFLFLYDTGQLLIPPAVVFADDLIRPPQLGGGDGSCLALDWLRVRLEIRRLGLEIGLDWFLLLQTRSEMMPLLDDLPLGVVAARLEGKRVRWGVIRRQRMVQLVVGIVFEIVMIRILFRIFLPLPFDELIDGGFVPQNHGIDLQGPPDPVVEGPEELGGLDDLVALTIMATYRLLKIL